MNYIAMFLLLPLAFAVNAFAADVPSPVRLGLGLESALPQFSDEDLLSGIRGAVENSGVYPINTINVGVTANNQLSVSVVGSEKKAEFVCSLKDKGTVCTPKHEGAFAATQVSMVTEVPFGNIKAYGFKSQEEAHGMGLTSWVAVSVVAVYALKKIGNWWFTGTPWADPHDHSHFFLTPAEMKAEFAKHEQIVHRLQDKVATDLTEVAAPLIVAAGCGHDHHDHDHHDHDHDHGHGFKCEAISPEASAEAQKTLLGGLGRFGVNVTRDIYVELIKPLYDGARATVDPEMRKQAIAFADLVTRRMIEERGVLPGVITIGGVSTAEIVWETLETFLMPAGHFFCNVGNVAILGIAASAYTAYQCLRETAVLKGTSLTERLSAAARISRIQWRAGYGLKAKSDGLTPSERIALSMNVVFRLVERDLRHSRNLDWIDKKTSRAFAQVIGELKRDLNTLSLRAVVQPPAEQEWSAWLQRLVVLRNSFEPPAQCEAIVVQAAAS